MNRSSQQQPNIYGFVDESVTDDVVTCAAAVFSANRASEAEAKLAAAKESVGLPPDVSLHCKVIFSGDARRGTPWENVNAAAIDAMVVWLCQELKQIGYQPIVVVTDRLQAPQQLVLADLTMVELVEKGVVSVAYTTVFAALIDRFGLERVRVWIDPDRTKIPWGRQRRQAHLTRSISVDLWEGKEKGQFVPLVDDNPKPRLLEVADLYAYVVARAHKKRGSLQHRVGSSNFPAIR